MPRAIFEKENEEMLKTSTSRRRDAKRARLTRRPPPQTPARRLGFEQLECRAMLNATISGTVIVQDLPTGGETTTLPIRGALVKAVDLTTRATGQAYTYDSGHYSINLAGANPDDRVTMTASSPRPLRQAQLSSIW